MHKRTTLDTPLFHRIYALYKLIYLLSSSIPKAKRYTLWLKVEEATLSIITGIIQAGHCRGKQQYDILLQISASLDLLKVLIRLCKEIRCIDMRRYLELEKHLQEAGKMQGGWIKFASPHSIARFTSGRQGLKFMH